MPKKEEKTKGPIILKSEDEKVRFWKDYVNWGIAFKDTYYTANAERWLRFFKGTHWPDQDKLSEDTRLVVNYCYSITKSIVPQIYFQDPYFYVTAAKPKFEQGQAISEAVLNNEWQVMGAKKQIRRIVQDFLVMSFGAVKQAYHTKFVRDYSKPDLASGLEYTEFIEEERPWLLRVSPQDIIFDPEAKHFDERRWHAIKYVLPVVQAKQQYSNLSDFDEKEQGAFSKQFTDLDVKFIHSGDNQMFSRIIVWEIHDLSDNKILTIGEGVDKFLEEKDNPYDFHTNLTLYSPNTIPDELYPISEISQIADLNWELDQVRTQMMNHRKKMQRKIIAEHGAFPNDVERKKFLSGEDMQMVIVTDGAISSKKIMIVDASGISPSFYQYDDKIINDMQKVSATGANLMANPEEGDKTATEAAIIDKNAGLRNSERLDYMAEFSVEVATKLFKTIQKFGTGDTFYSEKLNGWIEWAKKNIAGDYNVNIHMGATARRSEEAERAMIIQLLPSITQMVGRNGQPACNQPELFRYLFKKYGMTEEEIKRIIYPESDQPPQPNPPRQESNAPQNDIIAALLGGGQYGMQGERPMNTQAPQDVNAMASMQAGGMQ
uniref:Putative head tail connector protein n=1 Tax=viral metagenome TaxID=1070528 RepID=A0A6H1ZCX8_9ZZZZ